MRAKQDEISADRVKVDGKKFEFQYKEKKSVVNLIIEYRILVPIKATQRGWWEISEMNQSRFECCIFCIAKYLAWKNES